MLMKQEIFSYPRNLIFVTFCKSQILPWLDHPPFFYKRREVVFKIFPKKGGGVGPDFSHEKGGVGKIGELFKTRGRYPITFF